MRFAGNRGSVSTSPRTAPPHEFVEMILGLADHNSAPIEIGVKAVELVAGAYESARANAPVKVAP